MPTEAFNAFGMIASSKVRDYVAADATGDVGVPHRQTYHAMVYYMDGVVREMRKALEDNGLWATTLWFHQSDNGGPSFAGSSHTANNYPLKGSKTTNWQGGIRVNAFVSGGFLKTAAPDMIGRKLDGFVHVCDWYATWCSLAGVDKEDSRAAAANSNGASPKLPPVDGIDLWPYLSGKADASPRKEIFADAGVLLLETEGRKWKLFGATPPDGDDSSKLRAVTAPCAAAMVAQCSSAKKGQRVCAGCIRDNKLALHAAGCTLDNGKAYCAGAEAGLADPTIYESRADGSVLVGLACWAGPQYPNGELTHCKHKALCSRPRYLVFAADLGT